MKDAEREQHIERFKALLEDAWKAGNKAEARFYCRVFTGLIRGRKQKENKMRSMLPLYSTLPIEVWRDKRLTLNHIRVLGAMYAFRKDGSDTISPSRDVIAALSGIHPATISTARSALVRLGWLRKEPRNPPYPTEYTFSIPDLPEDKETRKDDTRGAA